jgi:hypothetical protein
MITGWERAAIYVEEREQKRKRSGRFAMRPPEVGRDTRFCLPLVACHFQTSVAQMKTINAG